MFKFLAKQSLKLSENEIINFIQVFESGDVEQNSIVMANVAQVHFNLSSSDPSFSKLVNSELGENQGAISTYILQFNRLNNEANRAGLIETAVALKFWNTTFRSMSTNQFAHYGDRLWKFASQYFPSARYYLAQQKSRSEENGNLVKASQIEGALSLISYVPPQFR